MFAVTGWGGRGTMLSHDLSNVSSHDLMKLRAELLKLEFKKALDLPFLRELDAKEGTLSYTTQDSSEEPTYLVYRIPLHLARSNFNRIASLLKPYMAPEQYTWKPLSP
ncbi:hypothetical protein BLX24_21595 [Arsenicibacter rosenii]|uniref:Uncharacterized protein n=2 Tax=Arsenicibacter rosenii TaxID=1750698 RepID=A0A1S2VEF8_9BACT|nr:hypothetical protein BLX24_21595 [Arsenicibacter rosenii]